MRRRARAARRALTPAARTASTALVSGSDDCRLGIWRMRGSQPSLEHLCVTPHRSPPPLPPPSPALLLIALCSPLSNSVHTGHVRNIFAAQFVPRNEAQVVSGGMDTQVRLVDLARERHERLFATRDLVAKLLFVPWHADVFLSTHYDGTVRRTDLREPRRRPHTLLHLARCGAAGSNASALAFDPLDARHFVLGGGDEKVRTAALVCNLFVCGGRWGLS